MSRLDFWFRLFHHAALGLASVCLLYAEAFFLPTPLLIGLYLMAGLQVLAFGADGRRWVLPGWAANLLAGAVAGGGAAWIGVELNSPDSVLADLPLPAGLLPYIGPILIGLLVVKLFRPRTPRDFWLLQGVGALQVALASVLATNPESGLLFGLLLAAYLGCALCCLALHYFQEEHQAKSNAAPAEAPRADAPPGRLPFAYRMAPFCCALDAGRRRPGCPVVSCHAATRRADLGFPDSERFGSAARLCSQSRRFHQGIDLNRVGSVTLNSDEVFRVAVAAAPGQARAESPRRPALARRRPGLVCPGLVEQRGSDAPTDGSGGRRLPSRSPPLRPGKARLDFTVAPQAGGLLPGGTCANRRRRRSAYAGRSGTTREAGAARRFLARPGVADTSGRPSRVPIPPNNFPRRRF